MDEDTKHMLQDQMARAEQRAKAKDAEATRHELDAEDARAGAARARAMVVDLRQALEQAQ